MNLKPLKGKSISGVCVGRFHTVVWTPDSVFTVGLNAGQLGKWQFQMSGSVFKIYVFGVDYYSEKVVLLVLWKWRCFLEKAVLFVSLKCADYRFECFVSIDRPPEGRALPKHTASGFFPPSHRHRHCQNGLF